MADKVKFNKGLKANMPSTMVVGTYYQCTDTGELYLATSTTTKVLVKDTTKNSAITVGADTTTTFTDATTIHVNGHATNPTSILTRTASNLWTYIKGKIDSAGYKTTDTTYTFASGDANGQIKVTPLNGTAQNVAVKGLDSAAYTKSTDYAKKVEGVHYLVGEYNTTTYPTFDTSKTYAVGDLCVYSNVLYKCTLVHSGAWNSGHFSTSGCVFAYTVTDSEMTDYYNGYMIALKMPASGSAQVTLNVNGKGAKVLRRNDGNLTTQLVKNSIALFVYDGTYFRWADYDANSMYTAMINGYCNTAATTAAKVVTCTNFSNMVAGTTIVVRFAISNTIKSKLTINVNGQGAKDLYINGVISSDTNYTLDAGTRTLYYDGTCWHVRNDKQIEGVYRNAVALEATNGRIASADIAHNFNNGKAHLQLDVASSTMTTGKPTTDGYIMTYLWDNSGMYDAQFFIANSNSSTGTKYCYTRWKNNGTWTSWEKLYAGYADSSAKSEVIETLTVGSESNKIDFNDKVVASRTIVFSTHSNYSTNYPGDGWWTCYSSSIAGTTTYATQFAQREGDGLLFIRKKTNGTWSAWKQVAVTGDIPTSMAWSSITGKPTTISGYGITDAKIASGVITLGENSITPLTSHQSVTDHNPTLAWSTKSKVATIGSTEINVTMPANPNTDSKVNQVNTTTSTAYRVLFSANGNDTDETSNVRKSANFLYNPGSINSSLNGTFILNPTTAKTSYNQGLRLNRVGDAGWATLTIGGASGSASGTDASTWLIGKRGTADATLNQVVGDLVFAINGADGATPTRFVMLKNGGSFANGTLETTKVTVGTTKIGTDPVTMEYNSSSASLDFIFA